MLDPDASQPDEAERRSGLDPLTFLVRLVWIVGLAAIGLAGLLWLRPGLIPAIFTPSPKAGPTARGPATGSQQIPAHLQPDAATAAALQTPPFHIRRSTDNERRLLLADLGLDAHTFRIRTRPNRRVYLWVELYRDGQLRQDRSFGVMYESPPDRPVQEVLRFTRLDPRKTHEKGGHEAGRVRWTLGIGASSASRWLDDPMRGLGVQGGASATPTVWELGSGRARTLWHLAAATRETGSVQLGSEAQRRQNKLYIALRCRVEPAEPDRTGSTFKSLSRVPPD